jgi:uncharacterized protein (TIGR02231 family)
MRAASLTLLFLLSVPATAADVEVSSRIDAVTVFTQGAEITRLGKARVEPGSHVLVIGDLPAGAIGSSIRVEGRATGKLDITSVDHRVVPLQRADQERLMGERRQIEAEIERLKDEKAVVNAAMQAAELQKTFVAKLTELPTHPAPGGGGLAAAPPDWAGVFNLIGARMQDAQRVVLGGQVTLRELDRRLSDLEKKLTGLNPRPESRTEVKIFVTAGAALEADVAVRYQVAAAGWQPLYDARLSAGARNVAPRLTLTRRATITQRTGENWTDIALTLSTARPAASTAAPVLPPLTVDYLSEPRPLPAAPPAPVARAPMPEMADGVAKTRALTATVKAEARKEDIAASERVANIDAGAFQAAFALKDRTSVPATGEAKRVLVEETHIEPALVVRTVPRLDPRAYIYAKVVLPRTAPYLAGPLALFRDQTFIGSGRLPQLAPGEEHEIGFGADDLVRVRYSVADEKRGESGLISSTRTDQRSYRITLKSLHERPIAFSVIDRMPASNNQEIKVELTGRTTPTKRDVEDRRGVLAWEDKLNADEERVIDFGYRVSWPAAKQIRFEN